MNRLTPAQRVREALSAAGHDPLKSLSQNFMIDPNILERVAEATGVGEGDHVLEIGPGPGVLTALLLERGASVRAIELDCAMAGYLRVAFTGERLELLVGDILSMSLDSLLGSGQRWTIASNLPYSISTPLLYELPAVAQRLNRVVLTLQREVAERACAGPGHPARGAVSAMIRRRFDARILRRIPAAAFLPAPKVESALLELQPRAAQEGEATRESYRTLVRAAFGLRRKVISGALTMGPDALPRDVVEDLLRAGALTGRERAETVSEAQFEAMARELDRIKGVGE